jgi:hypothetical protein
VAVAVVDLRQLLQLHQALELPVMVCVLRLALNQLGHSHEKTYKDFASIFGYYWNSLGCCGHHIISRWTGQYS